MKGKIQASVAILTYNNEGTIKRCLESVKDFAEIIVCDGGSTDQTRTIVESYDAKVIDQDAQFKNPNGSIANFSGIRNQTLDAASHEWFLFVDSDEHLSQELVEEIRNIVEAPLREDSPLAYWMPRKWVYLNKTVACSTTYPSHQMRFFHKAGVNHFIKSVHERIEVKPTTKTAYLKNHELVPFESSKDAWKKKLNYYLDIEAERQKEQSLAGWIRFTLFNTCKLTILYGLRFVRMALFCRGHKMPFWYETMQYWYHWNLALKTGRKFLPATRTRTLSSE